MPSCGADPDRTHLLEAGLHLPFSFCLRTHLQRSVQVAIGSQLILEGRDSSEIPQLVCVFAGGWGGVEGVAMWGACPAPLWRRSTQACVWSQWCPVLSCAWVILSFFSDSLEPSVHTSGALPGMEVKPGFRPAPTQNILWSLDEHPEHQPFHQFACHSSSSGQGAFFLPQLKPSLSNERTDIFTSGQGQDGHRLGSFHCRNKTLACGLMVQHQPGTCDALGSIPGTKKEKEWKLMLDPSPSFFSTPEQVEDPDEFLDLRRSGIST